METDEYTLTWVFDFLLLSAPSNIIGVSIAFAAIIFLLVCSALISGSEVAYFSLGIRDLEVIKKQIHPKDKFLLRLLENPGLLLATILIANNFINIAIIIISSFALGEVINPALPEYLKFLIEVVLVTSFLVLFGEISPKIYATLNNLSLARFMGRPLLILKRLFLPLGKKLVQTTSIIEQRMKAQQEKNNTVSIDDIESAIAITVKELKGTKQEEEMLKGVVYFGNIAVKQVMTNRTKVTAIDIDSTFKKVLELIEEEYFSRIPVYKEDIDHIKGILYVKDLLPHLSKETFEWQSLLRDPRYVPETQMIDDILDEFKQEKVHIAVVVDEFGGTSGIVTLEDILEEIIGDIRDEFDSNEDEIQYFIRKDNYYTFEGRILLNDFYRIMNLDPDIFDEVRGDADSLAGLILAIEKDIPEKGDIIRYKQFQFKVASADERKISTIHVTLLDDEDRKMISDNESPIEE